MMDDGRKHEGEADGADGEEVAVGEEAILDETEPVGDEAASGKHEAVDAGVTEGDDDQAPSEPTETLSGHLKDELAKARQAAQENLDRALRAHAELENVRRRMERNVENAHKFALEQFVSELLPVKDSLELGLAASTDEGASTTGIAEGVGQTLRMLEQAMEKFGVRSIDPAGEPFDPEFHQAMTMQESATVESGAVLTVVQKGYLLNERLVRPAMVIVAK